VFCAPLFDPDKGITSRFSFRLLRCPFSVRPPRNDTQLFGVVPPGIYTNEDQHQSKIIEGIGSANRNDFNRDLVYPITGAQDDKPGCFFSDP